MVGIATFRIVLSSTITSRLRHSTARIHQRRSYAWPSGSNRPCPGLRCAVRAAIDPQCYHAPGGLLSPPPAVVDPRDETRGTTVFDVDEAALPVLDVRSDEF